MAKVKLSDFEIGEQLGIGTVGTIYRAKDSSGREVALKILLPSVCSDPLVRARFEREMMILEKLSHPHIIQYSAGGRDGDQWFYAMELMRGGTVKQLLERYGRLTWQEVAVCGTQICSALQHAHNYGIIHRDVKPSNLYLTLSGKVKLGDFGIARDTTAGDLTSKGLTVGTYAYMSPEQICGDENITGKTDLYALGCLLFEMITGQAPFQGSNFAQLFEQHLRSQPPRVRAYASDCPRELDDLIAGLMAKDPLQRPFNARMVQGTLYRLLEGETADAVRPSPDQGAPAASAVDEVQALLRQRIRKRSRSGERREVSLDLLACLLLFVAGLVLVAWKFAT